jgi:hypothetical protein
VSRDLERRLRRLETASDEAGGVRAVSDEPLTDAEWSAGVAGDTQQEPRLDSAEVRGVVRLADPMSEAEWSARYCHARTN